MTDISNRRSGGGSGRRTGGRYSTDERRRPHHSKPYDRAPDHYDPKEDMEKRLASLIVRVGDKYTDAITSNMEQLANILDKDFSRYGDTILSTICASVLELPHKTAIYACLTGLLNTRNPEAGNLVIRTSFAQLKQALEKGDWLKIKIIVRFFGSLVTVNAISVSSYLDMLEKLNSIPQEIGVRRDRADCFVYILFAALPYCGSYLTKMDQHKRFELFLQTIDQYMRNRNESMVASLGLVAIQPYRFKCPYEQDDVLYCLWEQIWRLKDNAWNVSIFHNFPEQFADKIAGSTAHELGAIEIPTGDDFVYPLPEVMFRIFLDDDAMLAIPTPLPGPYCIERFIFRDVILDLLSIYESNRKECVKLLMALREAFDSTHLLPPEYKKAGELIEVEGPDGPHSVMVDVENSWRLEAAVVEVLFGRLFQLPNSPLRSIYYSVVLCEMMRPQTVYPQVFGKAVRNLFDRLDRMDVACMRRFWEQFAIHLSNHSYYWPWQKWEDTLLLQKEHPQMVFMKESLGKMISLAYFQRIEQTLPDQFKTLIPEEATKPQFKYLNIPSDVTERDDLVTTVRQHMSDPNGAQELVTMLQAYMESRSASTMQNIDFSAVLLECLLERCSKSLSHLQTVIEKYVDLLRILADSEDGELMILECAGSVWKDCHQFLQIFIDKLLTYRVIESPSVVNFIFSFNKEAEFHRAYIWEILDSVLNKMVARRERLDENLAACRTKIADINRNTGGADIDDTQMGNTEEDHLSQDIEQVHQLTESRDKLDKELKELFVLTYQNFVRVMDAHLQTRSADDEDLESDYWWRWTSGWFRDLVRKYYNTLSQFLVTVESTVFGGAATTIEPRIVQVFNEARALVDDRHATVGV